MRKGVVFLYSFVPYSFVEGHGYLYSTRSRKDGNSELQQPNEELLSCTKNSISSFDALSYMEDLTYTVSSSPLTLALLAEGGAAGSGGSVVSEGQGYALLTSAIALASLDISDSNRDSVIDKFYGYFNGWRKMCINSSPSPCQSPQYCTHSSGVAPCLPGWKHSGDLTEVEGTGAAPDGDEDAILGMIIAMKALEKGGSLPTWYDELRQWTDESCTQFLKDNTVLSNSKSHRLIKLGSCWGGWNSDGNNPSYPAPGAFRVMRDFHISYDGTRNYVMPDFGDSFSLKEKWNMLIDTTYKFYGTTQCTESGVVPNWALVKEVDSQNLAKQSGSFSGSGTPQYEFGAEASRTMWRVALDAILYPEEASAQSGSFLEPIHLSLRDGFNEWDGDWDQSTLKTCSHVNNIFNSWQYNGFIFGPLYSTLAVQATSMTTAEQQKLINAACKRVGSISSSASYYAKSWQVISMMTLNGDAQKVGKLLREEPTQPTISPAPTMKTTKAPTSSPTTNAPVQQPVGQPTIINGCCSFDFKNCGASSYCNDSQSNCGDCDGLWIEDSPKQCIALYQQCTTSSGDCCGPASCTPSGGGSYMQCMPSNSNTPAPVVAPAPTIAPTTASPITSPITSAPISAPITNPPGVPTPYPTERQPTLYPTHNAPTPYPTHKAPTPYPTGKAPPTFPPFQSCAVKGEPCQKHEDCCKNKCRKKKCKK